MANIILAIAMLCQVHPGVDVNIQRFVDKNQKECHAYYAKCMLEYPKREGVLSGDSLEYKVLRCMEKRK